MENKNILFSPSDNNATSGAFLSMVKLCTILQEKGFNIIVLLHCNGNGEKILEENNIKYKKIYSFNWFIPYKPKTIVRKIKRFICFFYMPFTYLVNKISIMMIKRLIKNEKIDLVHINTSCSYVAAVAAFKAKVPYVWHIREFLEEDQERTIWNKSLAKRLMRKSNAIITISESLCKKYENFLGNQNVYKIYNGIDQEKFERISRTILNNDKVSILMVGAINESKGQIQAIKALEMLLNNNYKNIELTIVGKYSEYANKLMKQIEGTETNEYVRFVGPQKNVEEYYKHADIVLMCSKAEAFGRVTVEAMMSGCVVIGANSGGTLELIDDKETGFLYKSGDINDLEQKIEFVLNNKDEARQVAIKGRMYMLKNMTAENNANKVIEIYKKVEGEQNG